MFMKKKLYMTIVGLGIVALAKAQPTPQLLPSISFGIKGGTNLTTLSTHDTFNADSRAGYLAGIWGRVGVVGWFVQPELYYSRKKATFNNEATGAENTVVVRGLDLPVLIGRRFGMNGVYGRVNTGPVISFATKNDQTQDNIPYNSSRLITKSQGLQWQFGAGVDISRISLDLRYELGLNKIRNGNQSTDVRFNNFNLALAYRLFSL
jgi:hypothetical protein